MNPRTAAAALASATAALVTEHDTLDVLARLMRDCAEVVRVDSVGLVVTTGEGGLELLASTSHEAAELEIFQVAQDEGPCVESIRTGTVITAHGHDHAIPRRWPKVGRAIAAAGFAMVHAQPLLWYGGALGTLNLFRSTPVALDEREATLARAFSDVATLAIVTARRIDLDEIQAQARQTLRGRVIIEQAKGVLAYTQKVDMGEAYELIVQRAVEQGTSLSQAAAGILAAAGRGQATS